MGDVVSLKEQEYGKLQMQSEASRLVNQLEVRRVWSENEEVKSQLRKVKQRDLQECELLKVKMAARGIVTTCAYVLCRDNQSHATTVCRHLHSRCYKCHHRGHMADECAIYPQARLRDWFESIGDLGRYTQKRHLVPEWGYFDVLPLIFHLPTSDDGPGFPVSYRNLTLSTVEAADRIVEGFNKRVLKLAEKREGYKPRPDRYPEPFPEATSD